MNFSHIPHYPIGSYPHDLRAVIFEHLNNNEAALPTIGCSLISALSAAIQDKADVERIPATLTPCTINTLVVAGSGSRKTTTDRMMTKVFSTFENAALHTLKPQIAAQKAKSIVWKAEFERLEKQLKGDSVDDALVEKIQLQLATHIENEPKPIQIPNILYKDATPEALGKGLNAWSSALLNTNEAGALMGGRAMSNLGFFNERWDGDDLHIDRVSSESFVVKGPRLTISLMVPEKTFGKFLEGQGALARDNGFLARFLVCYPSPLEGTRLGLYATRSWENHDKFQSRLLDILMSGIPVDGVRANRKTLSLSVDAYVHLKNFSDDVERSLGWGGSLSDIKDCASKIAENAARLAGIFHYYAGIEGPISVDTMRRAVEICTWHMLEFKRLFGDRPQVPLEFQDAILLEKCLSSYSASRPGMNWVPKRYLLTHGPNAVRNKARLDLALQVLGAQGKTWLQRENRTWIVRLNTSYFQAASPNGYPSQQQGQQISTRGFNPHLNAQRTPLI